MSTPQVIVGIADPKASGVAARGVIGKGLTRFTETRLPKQDDVEKVSTRVLCVLGQNPTSFSLNGTNTYLIGTGPRRILVDTGESGPKAPLYAELLEQTMRTHGIEGIQEVVCTHGHYDHVGGIASLRARYGEDLKVSKYPLPRTEVEALRERVKSLPFIRPCYELEANRGYTPIRHGQVFKTEGATLTAHYTPGHASDHVVLFLEEDRALITGDNILGWGTTWIQDELKYMGTLHKMAALKPEVIYPGHGPMVQNPQKTIAQYISHRTARQRQVAEILQRQPGGGLMTVQDIVTAAYPSIAEKMRSNAEENVVKVLRLWRDKGMAMRILPSTLPEKVVGEGPYQYNLRVDRSSLWRWNTLSRL
eukprot:Sspe_Gene.94407::Locus_66793_Transcript_1_1_Confidence_1.000_Length_1252::g.94407::m.94407